MRGCRRRGHRQPLYLRLSWGTWSEDLNPPEHRENVLARFQVGQCSAGGVGQLWIGANS